MGAEMPQRIVPGDELVTSAHSASALGDLFPNESVRVVEGLWAPAPLGAAPVPSSLVQRIDITAHQPLKPLTGEQCQEAYRSHLRYLRKRKEKKREKAGLGPKPVKTAADRVNWCGEHQSFTIYCGNCGEKKKITARCGDRTCGVCRFKEFFRLSKGHRQSLLAMREPKFLTLTLKRQDQPTRETVLWLLECFKKLMRRKFYRERIRGGLRFIEIVNKTGEGWHIHLHVILDAAYLPQKKLSRDWLDITGNSYVVDIRAKTPKNMLNYMLEYLKKEPEIYGGCLTYVDRFHRRELYNELLFRIRTVQPFGEMYGELKLEKLRLACHVCGSLNWISETEEEWMKSRSSIETAWGWPQVRGSPGLVFLDEI